MNYRHSWEKLERLLTAAERTLAGSAAPAPDDETALAARLSAEHAMLTAAAARDGADLARTRASLDAALREQRLLAAAVQELTAERDRLIATVAHQVQEAAEQAGAAAAAARAQESLANENRFLQAELGYRTRTADAVRQELVAAQQVIEEQRAALARWSNLQTSPDAADPAVPAVVPAAVIDAAAAPVRAPERLPAGTWVQRVLRWLGEPMVVVPVERPSYQRKQQP